MDQNHWTSTPKPGRRLQQARDSFLTSGDLNSKVVREPIQASWLRSSRLQVDTDNLDPAYHELDGPTPLALSAAPVLSALANELANESVSIILTDRHGLVLQRACPDPALVRQLDKAYLAPGFSYAEEEVGTNGIGTALEAGVPTMVTGSEHFTGSLGGFACAGAPIHHPVTGSLLGVLDLTSSVTHSNALLMFCARSTAQKIEQQLLTRSGARELALFRDYLAACQHPGSGVMALSADLVMMNNQAQQRFDPADQAALLARSADAAGSPNPVTLVADLPSGLVARMDYRPSFAGSELAGGVLRIQVQSGLDSSTGAPASVVPVMPGLAGTSATWQRVCQAVDTSRRNGSWMVLEGEAGVGKIALLRSVNQLRNSSGHFRVMDSAEASPAWLDTIAEELSAGAGSLVVRRAHLLDSDTISALSELLLEYADQRRGVWVALTMRSEPRNPEVDAQLLPHFSHTVEVPPLRHHLEDMHKLVPHLLGRLNRGNKLSISPAALAQLMRLPWLGNVEQLRRVLLRIAQHRRSGTIELDDLPGECRATTRRRLTQLESLERDAVVKALVIHRGNKDKAASDLGMSRATIYRKIRDYGIVLTI
ncbi:sigma-54-dependent Fis family transcriptional regulator [Kribbella sp. VKM Ac-2568]|uniref:sigma-54-dependent Fis family transcriptional regulator n=1 Tax=Kribbella sp. VKM Ac-2568 TaxID=2512219 RepID=UPI0010525120|nr:helix-turn-helix domain-containing protein [Kribbella sp. VKM Ac-2568]TCM41188.1 regulatory Fis family protein [Kribbella sp. VKM Ac-2568]